MTSLQNEILALTLLQKQVKEALDKKRAEWAQDKAPGDRSGAVVGGESLGTVSFEKAKPSFKLTDPAAALAWAQEHQPQVVKFEPFLDPGWVTAVAKEPVTPDGEIIPGFELSEPAPRIVVRTAKEGAEVLSRALAEGAITFDEVLAVEQ